MESATCALVVSYLSYPLFSFVGLEAHCLIEILRHAGSLDFHRRTCAPSSCSLCSLSSTLQQTQPSVLVSLGLAESRILPAAPVDTRPRTPLISFCTVQLRTLRRSLFGDSLSLRPLVQTLGSCPASWATWFSAMPPSLGRGRVTTTTASATVPMEPLYIPCILSFCFTSTWQ